MLLHIIAFRLIVVGLAGVAVENVYGLKNNSMD